VEERNFVMSQNDEGLNPQAAEGEQEKVEGKFVSVQEAIRYRRRAQGAEKQAEGLAAELSDARGRIEKLNEELGEVKLEQKLLQKLSAAGVVDLEAAGLLIKSRIDGVDDEGIDKAVEKLKKEKQYLFSKTSSGAAAVKPTAGVKEKLSSAQTVLENAARRASQTGDRNDLQEYLRVRRNYL
jgi:hypothetical protein